MPRTRRVTLATSAVSLILASAASTSGSQARPSRYDLVIRNGLVADGSGRALFRADIAVVGPTIVAVGRLGNYTAASEIDAAGLLVAPGFINLHSHAEPLGLRVAENMLTQGVTTEILNADGSGALDIARQLRALDSAGLALNVGANVGFNSVWSSVVGQTDRRPTRDEIERMQRLIVQNLDAGAFGISSGLDYKPAYFAKKDEVIEVLRPAGPYFTNFPNHDRVTPEANFSSREGIRETIEIAEAVRMTAVATHIKAQGHEQRTAEQTTSMMAAATARGTYAAGDVYPYLNGMTGLGALIIPAWAVNGGEAAMRQRFADPAQRARIVQEADAAIKARFNGHDDILVMSTRRQLTTYMEEFGVTSPAEAVVRILEKESPAAILRFGDERDLVTFLRHPTIAVSCDCGATTGPTGHPRNYGTFPRVLGRYVREGRHLSWTEAIRKMSGLPATLIGMPGRGFLLPGMAADIAIIDTAAVIDRATYEEPGLLSEGVRHVIVNGRPALRDGKVTGTRAGRALTRPRAMRSHAMHHAAVARISLSNLRLAATGDSANGSAITVRASVVQRADRPATGTVSFRRGSTALRVRAVSQVEVAGEWGTIGGLVELDGTPRGFTLIVATPRGDASDATAHATLLLDGAPAFAGPAPRGAARVMNR